MKDLKIHLIWFLVVVIGVAAFTRILVARKEAEYRGREKLLKNEIRELKLGLARSEREEWEETFPPPLDLEDVVEPEPSSDVAEQPPPAKKTQPVKGHTPEDLRTLMRSKSRNDRRRALKEIAKLKDRGLRMLLLREAVKIGDSEIKYQAILQFDQLGKPEGTILAMEVLQSSESDWFRARAARELSQLRDPGTYDALMSAFREDNDYLKYWSAKALQSMGWEGPVGELVVAIGPKLDNPDGAMREDVIEKIGKLGSSAALPYLTRAASDTNSRVRQEAVQAMGSMGPAALPILKQSLNDPMRKVREEVVDSLRYIGGAEAIALLQVAINDPDSSVARRAQRALDRLQRTP